MRISKIFPLLQSASYIVFVNGLCSNIHAADFPLPCYSHKKESAGTIHKDIRRWAFNFFHADQQETRFLWKHKPTETDHFKLIWMNADLLVEDLEDGDRTSQPKDKVVTWNLPFRSDTSYLVQSTT
ncbi:hypothetical protein IGI04_029784 [Brassica rapa subsp. trilocularis]|uniref:Malectin-like domain-containing protein n=1 Tax=Brassica rapa subsp. trilocularis TaxID=1813537 RepID=A0ABQ7LRK7_BRACM|nr:hypothetical protein IGI04_029784 [Brassica rapa subsp. trilocularis]